ncbi:hypothetical protein [Streptomyces sp. NBC_01006]|uniref:hypothetical protein n=1 Tax=Streptomyces sp. NBC_01006 TaxID=2903716 RepID=UPI00386440B4|nr:hypothetical protein OG509_01725 [Streptomyces sp. NBC_01006]
MSSPLDMRPPGSTAAIPGDVLRQGLDALVEGFRDPPGRGVEATAVFEGAR